MTSVSSAWAYVKNQCTYYAALVATWIPAGLGNAADWLHNAQLKGYQTTSIPTVGSVAVYGRGGPYDVANGHVAVVESVAADLKTFTVGEQNLDERGAVQHGRISSMRNVLGFILPPGKSATGTPGGLAAGNANYNPFDLPGAIGNAVASIGKSLTQVAYILAGLLLFVVGLWLTVKAEGGKLPTPVSAPLRVIKGAKEAVA
jgi:surface antigen